MAYSAHTVAPTPAYSTWYEAWATLREHRGEIGGVTVLLVAALVAKKVHRLRKENHLSKSLGPRKALPTVELPPLGIHNFGPIDSDNPYEYLLRDPDTKKMEQAPLLMQIHDQIVEGSQRLAELEILTSSESLISDLQRLAYYHEWEKLEAQIYKKYSAGNIILKELGLPLRGPFYRRFTSEISKM